MQDEDGALVEWELAKGPLQLVTVRDGLHVVDAARDVSVKHADG